MIEYLIKNKVGKKRADAIAKKFPNAEILARGRHAVILLDGKYCVKIEKDIPAAKHAIANEAKWLKKMQGKSFASKFKEHDKKLKFISYRYVKGEFLPQFIKHANKKEKLFVIKKCMGICRELDRLEINKEEMHKPVKHVIIDYPRMKFIDWERCHEVKNAKNVTQFVNYLTKGKLLEEAKVYKKSKSEKSFRKLLDLVCQSAHLSS